MRKIVLLAIVSIFTLTQAKHATTTSSNVNVVASEPTHYYYTPTAFVNPPYNLVVSLHEISFSLPNNLQLQASLFDNIGRIMLGGKYGFAPDMSMGVGLASSLLHLGYGVHGVPPSDHRLGLFFCYAFLNSEHVEAVVVPHTQLFGSANSIGCDLGFKFSPSNFWSIIWEIGNSYDCTYNNYYFNTDGGVRIHPPAIPFMNFDLGIDVQEFDVSHSGTSPSIYFDVIFAMDAK